MRARPRRRRLIAVFVCAALAIGAATVGAGEHHGNSRQRHSSGEPPKRGHAQRPRAATTSSTALAGNDSLVGGAGQRHARRAAPATTGSCAVPGRDIARGDAKDKVGKDCEKVDGRPRPVSTASTCASATSTPTAAASTAPAGTDDAARQRTRARRSTGPPLLRIQTTADATDSARSTTSSLVDGDGTRFSSGVELTIGVTACTPIRTRDLSSQLDYDGPLS